LTGSVLIRARAATRPPGTPVVRAPREETHISLAVAVVVVIASGGAGAFLGHRLPVPAGVLLGTLVGVGVAAGGGSALLVLPQLSVPQVVNRLLQVLLGMMVGFRMTRDSLRSGAHALIGYPAHGRSGSYLLVSALIVAPLASLDVVTAVQLVRVLLAVAIVNVLLARVGSKGGSEESEPRDREGDGDSNERSGYEEDLKRLG
jgi:uncharacterized membrane protein AbrB (regulator of aidB expression)